MSAGEGTAASAVWALLSVHVNMQVILQADVLNEHWSCLTHTQQATWKETETMTLHFVSQETVPQTTAWIRMITLQASMHDARA
jgi:predicted nucleic acid-binding protein